MKPLVIAAAVFAAAPALAQPAGPPTPQVYPPATTETADDAQTPSANQPRINQLIVYGDDPCPRSTSSEIVVCARKPANERFRIPENLRDLGSPQSRAWSDKATELSYVGRNGTESCSPVGAGGMTGCLTQIINAAAAERENRDEVDWNRLIEQARQERLGQIDADSERIEQEVLEEEGRGPR